MHQTRKTLQNFNSCPNNLQELIFQFDNFTKINIERIYNDYIEEFEGYINNSDYVDILKVYNHKGVVKLTSNVLGWKGDTLEETAKRILNSSKNHELIELLKKHLPELPSNSPS